MTTPVILLVLVVLFLLAYALGRQRAVTSVGGVQSIPSLHSLPGYYGYWTALSSGIPALLLLIVWISLQNSLITDIVVSGLPDEIRQLPQDQLGLVVNDIQNVADTETGITSDDPVVSGAAERYRQLKSQSRIMMAIVVAGLAMLGGVLAWLRVSPKFRARNRVETIVTVLLFCSSLVAVFTTLGIVLSVLFEALRFFSSGTVNGVFVRFGMESSNRYP